MRIARPELRFKLTSLRASFTLSDFMASMHASTCNALTIYIKSLLACKIGIFVCRHYYQARQRIFVGIYKTHVVVPFINTSSFVIPEAVATAFRSSGVWTSLSSPGMKCQLFESASTATLYVWKCSNKRSNWFFTEDWKCRWSYCWGKPGMEVQRPFVSYHLHGVWDILHWKNENNGRNIWTLE